MKKNLLLLAYSLFISFSAFAQSKAGIKNNIKLDIWGDVTVNKAYLVYDEDKPVPAGNQAKLNQKIYLVLELNKSWVENTEHLVNIGGQEVITASTGAEVLRSADLFEKLETIKAEDAKYIKFHAVITNMTKPFPFFTVKFRVWDKNGLSEITGSYTMKMVK